MTTPEAIEILEQYNLYRRFKTDKGPSAKDAGKAIELAVECMKKLNGNNDCKNDTKI